MFGCITAIGVSLPYLKTRERYRSIYRIGAIGIFLTYKYSRLRRNFASVVCEGQCKAFVVKHSLRPTASVQCEGDKGGQLRSKSRHKGVIFTLLGLLCSSMSAEPPPKSTQLLPQLNKRPERQWPLPKDRHCPQTFLYGAERNWKIVIPPPQAPAERQTSGHL